MKRKIFSILLVASMVFLPLQGVKVEAEELNNTMQMVSASVTELETEELSENVSNIIEHQLDNSEYILSPYATCSEEDEINNDPNKAYLVNDGDIVQGTIDNESEMRWYGTIIDVKSKLSVYLETEDTIDADVYLFSLNQETYELELIGGSATSGMGVSESCIQVVDSGIYYFAISNYSGSGSFGFGYYQNSNDVQYEVNDTTSTASTISVNNTISAVIDNPNDIDFYSITLDEATAIRYSISGADYNVIYVTGAGGIKIKNQLVSLNAGTHFFAVYSVDGSCSDTALYNFKISRIGKVASDSSATVYACAEREGIIFQCDPDRTKFYVNGNLIDFSYSYKQSSSNSAGSQSYNIQLRKTDNFNVCMFQTEGTDLPAECQQAIPRVVRYNSSTLTGISGKNVLGLSVFDWSNDCYSIHNVCSGAYAGNKMWKDLKFCNIFVDPNTGKVIDIEWYNYFYEIGNHKISYYSTNSMKYYYPYYNGKEPEEGDD